MADEAVILIFGVFLVADQTRNLRSPGNLRCIMAFGTGYRPSLFWIFLPDVAVRTCEIYVGIPKRLLWRGFGRGGKTQDRQTYRQCPSVLHGGSNILKVIR